MKLNLLHKSIRREVFNTREVLFIKKEKLKQIFLIIKKNLYVQKY